MSESAPLPMDREIDPGAMLASLRECGADRFDPVRFHFIEAMARRAEAYGGGAKRILDGKLATALTAYSEAFEQARRDAGKPLGPAAERCPAAADDSAGRQPRGPLGDLVAYLAQHAPAKAEGAPAGAQGIAHAELKSVRYFRDTWSKLSVDQQLAQALAQGPENAGPLNSHLLVLQSLKLMRDISPDYLNRFISYVDALLWLEQTNAVGTPTPRSAARSDGDRKRKAGSAKTGQRRDRSSPP